MQPTVKAIPNGMQTITPHIIVWDAARAVEWYKEALGAEERSRIPLPGGKLMSVELWFGDSTVMVADEFVERDHHPLVHWLLAREVVVPTSQVSARSHAQR